MQENHLLLLNKLKKTASAQLCQSFFTWGWRHAVFWQLLRRDKVGRARLKGKKKEWFFGPPMVRAGFIFKKKYFSLAGKFFAWPEDSSV